MKIMFVCLGNICRSPLAFGVARKISREKNLDIFVDSCGTINHHRGEMAHEMSLLVARENDVFLEDFVSKPLDPKAHRDFDLYVVMDDANFRDVVAFGLPAERIVKLGDYGFAGADVTDPYGKKKADFEAVFEMIQTAVKNLLQNPTPRKN